jgi:hypothetical protein
METDRPIRRSPVDRAIQLLALALALSGCAIVVAWLCRRPPEPAAVQSRATAISQNKAEILAECQHAAGGDWQRWERETMPYRAALKARLDDVKPFDPVREPWLKDKTRVLEGRDGFPLFEVEPRKNLDYLYDSESLDHFRKNRAVLAAHLWFRQRGIDLILVPVPKMTEIFIEHFIDPCPPDGIIAPHVRQTLLELLNEGVEVVDAIPLFRRVRDADAECLYNTADIHWGPRAMRVMAKEVADRIQRYDFGAEARSAAPIVTSTPGSFDIQLVPSSVRPGDLPRMDGWMSLTAQQRSRAAAVQPRTIPHVTLLDGREPDDDPKSPVLLMGNSFVVNFREQLIKQMNLRVRTRWSGGQTTEGFSTLLREPEVLDGCRVAVWMTTEQQMAHFSIMPEPIMKALEFGK